MHTKQENGTNHTSLNPLLIDITWKPNMPKKVKVLL